MFASLRDNQRSFAITAVVALIVRTINSALYYRFVRGEASDQEVVDTVFSLPRMASFRRERYGVLFEAYIIACAHEHEDVIIRALLSEDTIDSPLLSHYRAEAEKSSDGPQDPNRESVRHAEKVTSLVDNLDLRKYHSVEKSASSIQLIDLSYFPPISLRKERNKR